MNPAALWDSLLGNQRHNSRTVTVCRSWQYWKRHPFIITSSPQDSGRLTHDWLTGCPSRHILFFLHSLLWSLGSVLSTQALSPHRVSCLSRLFSTIWRNIPHELESFPDMYTGTSKSALIGPFISTEPRGSLANKRATLGRTLCCTSHCIARSSGFSHCYWCSTVHLSLSAPVYLPFIHLFILQLLIEQEHARVGWSERIALKHVYYHMWNRSPVQVQCMRQGAQGWCTEGWDGEGGRKEGREGEHMYTNGWFMWLYGKNHYNIVK